MAFSAGALFGINYASNQKGRALRYNLKYLKDKRYMGFYSLFTTGNIVNKDFAFYDLPFNLDPFDQDEFEKSHLDFYLTATNIASGKAEYFKIKKCFRRKWNTSEQPQRCLSSHNLWKLIDKNI